MRSVFGWSLPPGCSILPGEEAIPPSCEDCEIPEDACPGMDKCEKVYLDGHPACCLKHRVEFVDYCGECEAEAFQPMNGIE